MNIFSTINKTEANIFSFNAYVMLRKHFSYQYVIEIHTSTEMLNYISLLSLGFKKYNYVPCLQGSKT